MKEKTKTIMFYTEVIMLIIWLVTTAWFTYIVFNSGSKCLANPLVYGARHLSEKNQADFGCICKFSNEPNFIVKVSSEEWYVEEISDPTSNTGYFISKEELNKTLQELLKP